MMGHLSVVTFGFILAAKLARVCGVMWVDRSLRRSDHRRRDHEVTARTHERTKQHERTMCPAGACGR
jgi:hypothetical protein